MSIYLIRHTTPSLSQEYCYGHLDLDVADNFEEMAETVKMSINLDTVKSVFSSPLIRCSKLANHLFPSKQIIFDERLKEINLGDWEGMKWNDIGKEELTKWAENFETYPAPNGESLKVFYDRVIEFWEALDKTQNDIAIVSHAGTMRMILSSLLQLPVQRSFLVSMKYAQILKLSRWANDRFQVEFI